MHRHIESLVVIQQRTQCCRSIILQKQNIRRNIEKLENSFAEMQIELKAIKTRMNNAEEWISNLEDRIMEITQSGQQTKNQMKNHESNTRNLQDNIKSANLHIIESRRRKKRKCDWRCIWRNYGWKLSKCKWNRYQDTGSTEGSKQLEPNQAHTKIYYNKNGIN